MCIEKNKGNKKEAQKMAVFSKPVQTSFEVREDKIDDFLRVAKTRNLSKALERASFHKNKLKNKCLTV